MTEKFRNKYRIATTRLKGYDYTRNGLYFITICTQKKIPCFGEINDGKMVLSEIGIIVYKFWMQIQDHFPNINLDEFIIMPDHIHGIIIIKSKSETKSETKSEIKYDHMVETPNLGVSTESSIQIGKYGNAHWKSNSIGSIINQFKRICTIKTKSIGLDFSWQPRFYDHIIRSDNELNRIRTYIKNNPNNWLNNEYDVNSNIM
jgi:REP element-mobilizing transposase RayT